MHWRRRSHGGGGGTMPIIARRHAAGKRFVGEIILDNPGSLNALAPDMVRDMRALLDEWQKDDDIAAVAVRGMGEKAFCAGGDVRFVYNALCENSPEKATQYFAEEYLLDYAVHCFSKPIVGWGGGIVMGGGMGVWQGCNFRVAASHTKTAMPEVKIGFFPDVGALFFMRRYRDAPATSFFLGLSGTILNASETLAIGAADFLLSSDAYDGLLQNLCSATWTTDDDMSVARGILSDMSISANDKGRGESINEWAEQCWRAAQNDGADAAVATLPEDMKVNASPLSVHVWTEYCLRNAKTPAPQHNDALTAEDKSMLRDVLESDYALAVNFVHHGDFDEGVRALLIDKDNTPQWRADHSQNAVTNMFNPPAEAENFARQLAV